MAPGDTARLYHALSSYSRDHWDMVRDWSIPRDHPLVLRDFVDNDRPTFPAHFKAYPADLPTLALPRAWPMRGRPAIEVLAGTADPPPATLDLARLARLLHLTAGVSGSSSGATVGCSGSDRRSRRAGCSRSRCMSPCATSMVARRRHWYEPRNHALIQVGPAQRMARRRRSSSPGIPWRTGWRYSERALGTSTGTSERPWRTRSRSPTTWASSLDSGRTSPTPPVSRLVGADGVQEFPLAIVSFGDGEPAIVPAGRASPA